MEMINVLYSQTVVSHNFIFYASIVFAIVGIAFAVVLLYGMYHQEADSLVAGTLGVLFSAGLLVMLLCFISHETMIYATVKPETSYTMLTCSFDIVERKGDLYILKEVPISE